MAVGGVARPAASRRTSTATPQPAAPVAHQRSSKERQSTAHSSARGATIHPTAQRGKPISSIL
eukprot:scaffold1467_cov30-Tisochrysis_lutea.AAC.1